MADALSGIAGTVQVIIAGKYEGTVSNFRWGKPRSVTQTAMANGRLAVAVGVAKGEWSFGRPLLKVASQQQAAVDALDGPVDIDVILPGSDQQWRIPNCYRGPWSADHNVDAGNTSESFSGVGEAPFRVR